MYNFYEAAYCCKLPQNGSDIPDHHKTLFLVLHHQSEKCIGVKNI